MTLPTAITTVSAIHILQAACTYDHEEQYRLPRYAGSGFLITWDGNLCNSYDGLRTL